MRSALAIQPEYAEAHFMLGTALKQKGDLDAAEKSLREATRLAPSDPGPYNTLGQVLRAKGDTRAAITNFRQAAELQDALPYTEPPYWYYPIRQSLGAALLQAGRYADARQQFELALRRAPSNGWSYYGLAELHKARGDKFSARKAEADLAKTWIGDRKLLQISNL